MIGDNFYNKDLRKATVAFGALFNNISFEKKDKNSQEIKRLKVPLSYGSKEKYIDILQSDPEDKKAVGVELPRMAFVLKDIQYDKTRAQQLMVKDKAPIQGDATSMTSKFNPAPYDLQFELAIMSREVDDGLQILEQIVYYFRPDYTVTIAFEPALGVVANKNTPIIMGNVNVDDNTVGAIDDVRIIIWTIQFTMKSYLYGPTDTQGQILHVFVNYYDNTVTERQLSILGVPVTGSTVRGSNLIFMSANVAGVIANNDVISYNDILVTANSVIGSNVYSNVTFATTATQVPINTVILPGTRVAAYVANIVPPTALSTDNYTISELFEDFTR